MALYFMLNKPSGCITARVDPRHKTVMDYFPESLRERIFPVGRLDKDTEGLLLFTDDGELCYNILRPEHHVPKTYFFWCLGDPDREKIAVAEQGVKIYKNRDEITQEAKIDLGESSTLAGIAHLLSYEDKKTSNKRGALPVRSGVITVTEGKKHQVKRTIRYCGSKVLYLKRLSMGKLMLDESLAPGEYRALTEEEVALLKCAK